PDHKIGFGHEGQKELRLLRNQGVWNLLICEATPGVVGGTGKTGERVAQWCADFAKVTPSHRQAGDDVVEYNALPQPRAFPVAEEKPVILLDRPTDRDSKLVATELVLPQVRSRRSAEEEIPGVETIVAEEFEYRAVELIGSGL